MWTGMVGRQAVLEVEFFGRITRMKVGLEILARLTGEQFEKLKEDKLATYKKQNSVKGSKLSQKRGLDTKKSSHSEPS